LYYYDDKNVSLTFIFKNHSLIKKKIVLLEKIFHPIVAMMIPPALTRNFGMIQSASSSPRVKMCDPVILGPKFKGIVITNGPGFLALLTFFLTLVGSTPVVSSADPGPYCIYLDMTQELRCSCQNLNFNRSQPTVFPNNDFFVPSTSQNHAAKVKEVAALKLTGCEKLHLTLDLRPLPHPFYRYKL
jgi:hypothetical protein